MSHETVDRAEISETPVQARHEAPAKPDLGDRLTGRHLNELWRVGARHALYHHEGVWYHQLQHFPGALFDSNGYVLFGTPEEFLHSAYLHIRKHVHVPDGIAAMPTYVRRR